MSAVFSAAWREYQVVPSSAVASDLRRTLPATDPLAIAVGDAIRSGDTARLESLLAEHVELVGTWIVDDKGVARSLAHIAADWPGHFPNGTATIAVLAQAGADLSAHMTMRPGGPEHRETPLHWAASSNDVTALAALLDHGAEIEADGAIFTGGTAMSDAVVFANWDAARLLLARGARTTYWQAAALGLVEQVREAFAGPQPPTADDATRALWHACRGGQRASADVLLAHGADPHWLGWDGLTPIAAAEGAGHLELAAWLRSSPPGR
jgi:hypothetical protein